jgi:hypothetical protein
MTTLTVLGYPDKLNRNLTRIHNVFLTKVVGEMSIQTYCAHSGRCVTSLLKQKHDRLCKVCELCSPAQCSSGCICATIWIRWVVLRRTNISCQSPTVLTLHGPKLAFTHQWKVHALLHNQQASNMKGRALAVEIKNCTQQLRWSSSVFDYPYWTSWWFLFRKEFWLQKESK